MDDPRARMQEALKQAMLSKDSKTRDTIRLLQSLVKQVEVDERRELTGEDVIGLLQKEVKRRQESAEEARKIGRDDLVEEAEAIIHVTEQFLPRQLSRDEIAGIVREVMAETGVSSAKEMGKLMGALMPRVKGIADGKLVNEVVRELLQ
ncbi:MAG: GatB/YqeY domain-containing protein [bacterium]|nr:GatB/YqeY domain-containing protein [bacterium]